MLLARSRTGTSEVVGSILTIAITLIVGASLFGFVNSQAVVSERQYGTAVQGNIAYLQERYVVAQVTYTSNSITLNIYDNGQIADHFVQIEVYNTTSSKLDIVYGANWVTDMNHIATCNVTATTSLESPLLGTSSSSFSVSMGSITPIKLTLPGCYAGAFKSGFTYYAKILGEYGESVTYFQGM
jgi:hypothetical protein